MRKLSNKVLSDVELDEWCRAHVPQFVGVIDRTQFPTYFKNMQSGDSIIINLDPGYETGGTHWTALRISSEAPLVYYKDSFGAPCPAEVIDSVGETGMGLVYGNKINQKLHQNNCGKRAAEFLYEMSRHAKQGREIEYFEKLED